MIAAALRWIAWSVLLARGGAWCERDYAELLDDVGAAGRAQPDPASWFRDVVRLAMLDFLDFADGDGGADGCLALADPWARRAWSQNSALYQLYESWRHRETALAMADFIVAAANGAMRNASAGARDPPFRFGRRDAMFCPDAADRLPASGTCGELGALVDQLGLTWTDAAALLGGSASAAGAEDFWDELLRSPETVAPPDPNATAPFGFPRAWPALPALPKLPSRDANRPRRARARVAASAVDDDDDDEAPANPFSNAAPAAPPRATIAVAGSFVDFDEEERKLIGL
ncbi:hypothetical protein SO694_00012359 [Aureococcus anophagefferens]|uniref:Plant heme peroxidase family profile domain-containing protein n=1 Tax=Aureococcus anophagefferens TaxID=44056 RepID=A0ABR1G1N3_AURAN